MSAKLNIVGKTDLGLVRKNNEDYLHIDEKKQVFAVCDGMGGHQAGDVASMTTSEILRIIFNSFKSEIYTDTNLQLEKNLPENADILIKAIRIANRTIVNKAINDQTLSGMGTTIVALTLDNDLLSVAHVGDSRAYRIDNDGLTPLTIDHSWVAEIQKAQNLSEEEASLVVGKNIITRALGVKETVAIDYQLIRIRSGDKFLLCSDGLCGYADDDEIFAAIKNDINDNKKMVDNLIELANGKGGSDNVTALIMEVKQVDSTDFHEVSTMTFEDETDDVLKAEDAWINKINEAASKKKANPVVVSDKNSRFFIYAIFAAFIIIAIAIILTNL